MTEKWLNLSIERDGPYSKLVVFASALLSLGTFGFNTMPLVLITGDWKLDKNLPFETATLHNTFVVILTDFKYFIIVFPIKLAFRNIMTIATSLLLPRLRVQTWTLLSLTLLIISMGVAFSGRYVETDHFHYVQIALGILNGSGTGIAFALMVIVPQSWLDKTRTQYNGCLLIGAPIGSIISSFIWPRLVAHFTWSGALLIIIGLQLQSFISWPIFKAHPDSPVKKSSFKSTVASWRTLCQVKGFVSFLLFNTIYIGIVMTIVLTLLINLATEYGVTREQSGYMFMTISLTDVIGRFIWGEMGTRFKTSSMIIAWSAWTVLTMSALAMSRTFLEFMICCFGIGVSFSGFGSHKHALKAAFSQSGINVQTYEL